VRTAEQKNPLFPQTMPEPFLDIARHCLIRNVDSRWTVTQIAARLEGRATVPQIQALPTKVPAPLPAPPRQPLGRPSRAHALLRTYAAPITVAFVLVLTAILAVPKLLWRHMDSPQTIATTGEQPLAQPAPSKLTPSPQKRSTESHRSSVAEEKRSSKLFVPVPATIHPDTMKESETNTAATLPTGSLVPGKVAYQAMPEVIQSARNSIQGTIRVIVKVNVDRSGNVEDAELQSNGPSKYFARAALGAAQNWKFKPPTVSGRGVLSSWTLRFEFTRDQTTVVPKQEMP